MLSNRCIACVNQVMFKAGDDLRQDQLILQLITLMDRLLRKENVDLKLTPYNVLACSGNPPYHGECKLMINLKRIPCTDFIGNHNGLVARGIWWEERREALVLTP